MEKVIRQLREDATGEVLEPGGPGFEDALRLYTRSVRGRPRAVLRARTVEDVALAVRATGQAGVALSMRGGGHSGAGFAVADRGLMLDLSAMRSVRVDPGRATASSGPGATWGDYDAATQRHGLASTGGVVSTTGVAGLTLGGGIGALRGLRGLAVDQLVAADVVLADGSTVTADAGHHPDLFWALRGGGGNFGVVVRFEFALHPVARLVTGLLGWPLGSANRVVREFTGFAGALPDHIVGELIFTGAVGEPSLLMTPRVVGTAGDAEPLLAPMRATGPSTDTVAERSYVDGQRFLDPLAEWGMRHYWHTCTLGHLDDEVVALLARFTEGSPSPTNLITVEHLHGRMSRIDPDSTPVGFRHAPYNVFIEAKWADPADDEANRRWARELIDALRPHAAGGAYVNYLPYDATTADIASAYGPRRFDRLRAIKARYDPANLFRTNQNIPPGWSVSRGSMPSER
ncbi:FAD-binding oxidoreductase [Pseudonocardia acaciae]|uniref:FAD-binding oxidoreductase n=1 Tax=Pseudonocardia acaciae TaxID=551276 RepID=UPI00068466EE|nr:FAD-binding oxidoreductase [Pseudonocardia acaciae]